MTNQVYLSSTLEDLREFRVAALEALRRAGYLAKDSYAASDQPTVEQCLKDVRECDLYVGIFAGRYGWRPEGHGGKSITELEYREAVRSSKRRFIFILPPAQWNPAHSDAVKGDYEADKQLRELLKELQDGKGHTCALITEPTDLALKLTQALPPAVAPSGMFSEPPPHPSQLNIGLLIIGVRGCDEAAVGRVRVNLPPSWQAASALFSPEPGLAQADRLALDQQLVRSRCAVLLLSPSGLARLKENAAAGAGLPGMLNERLGGYAVLLDRVTVADVPAAWPAPATSHPIGTWLADGTDTLGGELATLVQDFPTSTLQHEDVTNPRLVGLAWTVLAMTGDEARDVYDHPDLVKNELGKRSFDFFSSVTERLLGGGDWATHYGGLRRNWQPFGGDSVQALLDNVVEAINEQTVVPKRDQSALLGNRIRLRYYAFEPAAFKQGSVEWPLLDAMRSRGCLVLVDELSTLHPALHGTGNVFLSDPSVTVATLSGLDPAVFSLEALIDSPQKIDVLVDRFTNKLDPRCELAINNKARARRWLRLSLPEALAGAQAQGADPERRNRFRNNPSGRA